MSALDDLHQEVRRIAERLRGQVNRPRPVERRTTDPTAGELWLRHIASGAPEEGGASQTSRSLTRSVTQGDGWTRVEETYTETETTQHKY